MFNPASASLLERDAQAARKREQTHGFADRTAGAGNGAWDADVGPEADSTAGEEAAEVGAARRAGTGGRDEGDKRQRVA